MAHRKYINRKSYFEVAEERIEENHQLGFDYRDEIMNKTLSPLMFGDPKRDGVLTKFNDLFAYMIDSVKNVKKTFMYQIPRNSRKLN